LPHCENCRETYYRNAKPCGSILPIKNGKVLLARRGAEPYKGAFDIIGGFLNEDEHPEHGALREAYEETGLTMKISELLGMYIDQYGTEGDYTLNIHYIGEIVDGEMKAQDDVASLEWLPITELPLSEGFQNTRDGLRDLQQWYMNK
jgi:8-oxo-dGTP diphosphatase